MIYQTLFAIYLYEGPGRLFIVDNPPLITSWFGKSKIPVLSIPSSAEPVKLVSHRVPERMVDESSQMMHAFALDNCQITLVNMCVIDVNCGSAVCDAINMYSNGRKAPSCPCYVVDRRTAAAVLLLTLKITTRSGDTFMVHEFTSKAFTNFFLKGDGIRSGINASHFEDDRRTRTIFCQKMESVIEYVNQGGLLAVSRINDPDSVSEEDCNLRKGWSVHGWTRRGEVVDQGVEQPRGPILFTLSLYNTWNGTFWWISMENHTIM